MRLLFHTPQFLPSVGGLQHVVHYWAQYLGQKGHEVTITTFTGADDKPNPSTAYKVVRHPGFFELRKLMAKADLVVMFNLCLRQLPQWLLSGTPLWLSHHTALYYDDGPRPLLKRCKQWLANRLATGQSACSAYIAGLYKNCAVVHSPYDSGVFTQKALHRKPGTIIFAGRLVSDKGGDILIKAFALLQKSAQQQPLKLTVVGDGPERQSLEQLAMDLGVFDLVHFAGTMSSEQLSEAFNQSEILVVPSRMEPFGIIVLEGLACGCRVIVSRQGGLPEAGGTSVSYIAPGDAAGLAVCLDRQLSRPSITILGLDQFTIEATGAQTEKLWQQAIAAYASRT